jgi:hypothetical protein
VFSTEHEKLPDFPGLVEAHSTAEFAQLEGLDRECVEAECGDKTITLA